MMAKANSRNKGIYMKPRLIAALLLSCFLVLACTENGDDTVSDGDHEATDTMTDGDQSPDSDIEQIDGDLDDDLQESENGHETEPESTLPWLTARLGENPGIFTENGSQVLLRGVNFNHLGDYFQVAPSLPTVDELEDDDWDDAAAMGINVIRLVTTWSFWQPDRDRFDEAYLARVRAAIAEANAHDMYVVIDMHQDAWSKFVFTPVDEVCPEGTHHQKGWDGAPAWATFTDNEPTCTPGRREDSPAVIRAWTNFYANHEGIRDELVKVWAQIATEFAHHSGVAGFDLLNEPGQAESETGAGLAAFYSAAIDAIREAESQAGSPGHVIFFEPSVYATMPDFDMSDDPNLVFAAHNYFESITPGEGLLDRSFGLYTWIAQQYGGLTVWIGEYGSFSDPERNDEWMTRYATLEDAMPGSGGAWWQWSQRCGDPHNVQYPPTPEWLEQQVLTCDKARDFPMVKARCVNRAYPRAVPGILIGIGEGACDGNLTVTGKTTDSGAADLWYPTESPDEPSVSGEGIESIELKKVPGGWRIAVMVNGEYRIAVTMPQARKSR
jgi:endoglycosylceramidase